MNNITKPWSVNLWGSNPNAGNDDCHTGEDFATETEARACFANPWLTFNEVYYKTSTPFVELDGPTAHEVRKNAAYRVVKDATDNDWQREHAAQAGMTFGCDGYNDAMGY